jgi:hypothetical protein
MSGGTIFLYATLFKQSRQKSTITLFTFAFAPEEDAAARRDVRAAHRFHPKCGTAPYTPPKYFR